MKKLMLIFAVGVLTACGSSDEKEVDATTKVKPETIEKVKKAQDVNVELEEIDGELDSLLNLIE